MFVVFVLKACTIARYLYRPSATGLADVPDVSVGPDRVKATFSATKFAAPINSGNDGGTHLAYDIVTVHLCYIKYLPVW